MVQVASHLGGFLPGAEPKYLVPEAAVRCDHNQTVLHRAREAAGFVNTETASV